MKYLKTFGICLGLAIVTMAYAPKAEARTHINIGLGAFFQPQPRVYAAPCYVEEYYYPVERVMTPYEEHVVVRERPAFREVHVHHYPQPVPVYVRPRPFFSFGFFR